MYYDWERLGNAEEDLIARGIRECRAFDGPYHLIIFPTDRCNFSCYFCYGKDNKSELEWDVLKRVLESSLTRGCRGISIAGGGEPLVYGKFHLLLDFLEQHSLRLYAFTTNGSLLTSDIASRLCERDMRWMTVSLNETDAAAHAKMCGSSAKSFDAILRGIERTLDARKRYHTALEIRAQIFVYKGNFRRILNMISFALETKVDYVFVNTLDGLPQEQRMSEKEKEELKEYLSEALKHFAPKLQFRMTEEGLQRFVEQEQAKYAPEAVQLPDMCPQKYRVEYCYIGWHALQVTSNGLVFPCCLISGDRRCSVGNIYQRPLWDIWNGKDMQAFRREMRHLLLTRADKNLMRRNPRFIVPICQERAACNLNFFLCSPAFYERMDEWAEKYRKNYMFVQRIKIRAYSFLRSIPLCKNLYHLVRNPGFSMGKEPKK